MHTLLSLFTLPTLSVPPDCGPGQPLVFLFLPHPSLVRYAHPGRCRLADRAWAPAQSTVVTCCSWAVAASTPTQEGTVLPGAS